jgi:hypothetical protein
MAQNGTMTTERINIYLPIAQLNWLRAKKKETGAPITVMVVRILAAYIKKEKEET